MRSLVSIGFIHFPEYLRALIITKVFVFGACREEAAIRSYLYRGGWEQTWMVRAFSLTNYSSSESTLCTRLCDPSEKLWSCQHRRRLWFGKHCGAIEEELGGGEYGDKNLAALILVVLLWWLTDWLTQVHGEEPQRFDASAARWRDLDPRFRQDCWASWGEVSSRFSQDTTSIQTHVSRKSFFAYPPVPSHHLSLTPCSSNLLHHYLSSSSGTAAACCINIWAVNLQQFFSVSKAQLVAFCLWSRETDSSWSACGGISLVLQWVERFSGIYKLLKGQEPWWQIKGWAFEGTCSTGRTSSCTCKTKKHKTHLKLHIDSSSQELMDW